MKKKLWIPILTVVLVLCVVSVFLLYPLFNATPENTSTSSVDNLIAEIKDILSDAETALNSGKVMVIKKNPYVEQYVIVCRDYYDEYYADAFSSTDEAFVIDTSKLSSTPEIPSDVYRHCDLRYLILLSKIVEKYEDSFYFVGKFGLPDLKDEVVWEPFFYLCVGYQEAGFETPQEFYEAQKTNGDILCFYLGTSIINRRIDRQSTDIYPELLEQAL